MKGKTFGVLFVLALFLLSIPVAFARDGNAAGAGADDSVVETTDTADDASNKPVILPAKATVAAAKEGLQVARMNYAEAQQLYTAAKQRYQTAQQNIEAKKTRLRECQDDTTDECKAVVKQVKGNVNGFLTASADRVLGALEKLRNRIASSNISEEEMTELLASIDEKIAAVEAAKEDADALTDESTKDEIKAVTAQIKAAWTGAKTPLKKGTSRLMNEKIHGVLVKSEQLQTKLESIVTRLESQGYDVSGIEDLQADFDEKVAEAKSHYDLGVEEYGKQVSAGQIAVQMQAANRHMKESHKSLQEAHQILKQITAQIRTTQQAGIVAEDEDEEEETEEEETEEEEVDEEETEDEEEELEEEDDEEEEDETEANETSE